MNTLADILKLANTGRDIGHRSGLFIIPEIANGFTRMITLAIQHAYYQVTKDPKSLDEYPPLPELSEVLLKADQTLELDKHAQAYFLCAVAILLSMQGLDEGSDTSHYMRAMRLIDEGIIR